MALRIGSDHLRWALLSIFVLMISACSPSTLSTPEGTGDAGSVPTQGQAGDEPGTTTFDGLEYVVVDTGQAYCYSDGEGIPCPSEGEAFYGQDAQYDGAQPQYVDNGDGTITDLNTGLMWQQDPGAKMSYDEAVAGVSMFRLAGYDDWRLPTIKELYSLILFNGDDPSGCESAASCPGLEAFIDTDYFAFEYGDTSAGERLIDAQFISSTEYVGTTMEAHTVFGVNFADGRIKGYGTGPMPGQSEDKGFFVLYVRGNETYGENALIDNNYGTIRDQATGLIWTTDDSGTGMLWEQALNFCENLDTAGYTDWRLPNAKELHSIVDYTRSPDTHGTAALDPLFKSTSIINEAGDADFPYYWTSTTHVNWRTGGTAAAYLSFGRALGFMRNAWIDVHGAGSQRSDPKIGNPVDYPTGHGPQGDAIRIYNYARCVRSSVSDEIHTGGEADLSTGGDSPLQPGDRMQPPGSRGDPPPEAIQACTGLAPGSSCSFLSPDGLVEGKCRTIQEQLACVPEDKPPPG